MSACVNLLLLLSALLSALTGVGGTARQPQVAQAVAQQARAAATVAARATSEHRPVAVPLALAILAAAPLTLSWRIGAPVPAYASRRRE